MNKPKTQHSTAQHSSTKQGLDRRGLFRRQGTAALIDWRLQSLLACPHLHVRDTSHRPSNKKAKTKQTNNKKKKKKSETCSIRCSQSFSSTHFLFVFESVSANLLLVLLLLLVAGAQPKKRPLRIFVAFFFPFPSHLLASDKLVVNITTVLPHPFRGVLFFRFALFLLFTTCFWPLKLEQLGLLRRWFLFLPSILLWRFI